MKVFGRAGAIALATALGLSGAVVGAGPASAKTHRDPVRVIAKGLNGPFGLQSIKSHQRGGPHFVVAESDAGQVSEVSDRGHRQVLIDNIAGVSGVASGRGYLFALTGGPNEQGAPPVGAFPPSSVVRAAPDGRHPKVIADLLKYELAHNPDGQVQFVNGQPVNDALSNPFSMNLSRFGLLVADGGANDVLRVNPRTGAITTFFVPPNVKTPECLKPGAQANPGTIGCDSVPTGIAVSGNSVYVSTLGSESPGAGRVYRLDGRTGKVKNVYKGLTAPTGIAVSPSGTIYVSEVLYGAPRGDGPPPAGFNPANVGRITKISNGCMTHTQVTMPTGLEYTNGRLYASSWSTASSLGIKNAGQIVEVNLRSFS